MAKVNYEELYFSLFRSIEKAIRALEVQNYGQAKDLLVQAEQNAEEAYLQAGEKRV